MKKSAITPTRAQNYSEWYQQVISSAELAENSPVRGCMVIKPWGYAIWELMQEELDTQLKNTGHSNAYFPLLIPLSYLEKEAQHVEGFAKECAVVTHHRLVTDEEGKLKPSGLLEEPYVIRPTSETIIGATFAKWVKSYRDLPLLINQWANVVRWEMRPRLFLRTCEFLWQEGHTVHSTSKEAMDQALMILNLYEKFSEDILAIAVIKGEKPIFERFPGAVNTYCIEAMMQDNKALQAGTSHFLGQNFSKASNIQFIDQDGESKYGWTTSWGVTTRLIGGLVMTHSDDNGLIIPPKIAPKQIVILPIYNNQEEKEKIISYCENLKSEISSRKFHDKSVRVHFDNRDIRGGEKKWAWIKKGVPIIIEIGIKEIINQNITLTRRDALEEKQQMIKEGFINSISDILEKMQLNLLNQSKLRLEKQTYEIHSLKDFEAMFDPNKDSNGFAYCYAIDDPVIEKFLKNLKVSARCIPFEQDWSEGKCIFTKENTNKKIIFAKAY